MAHIHELYDFVTNALIVYDNKILLCNHPKYSKWIPIGGHIELDQIPDDAVLREIEEETGLEVEVVAERADFVSPGIQPQWTPAFVDVHEANPPHHHIALYYLARAKSDKFVLSEEHLALRWFATDDLDSEEYNLSPAVKFYAREALKRLAS